MTVYYKATRGLTNDKTGKRWEVGDRVKAGDFPKGVITAWVKRGVLVKDGNDGGNGNNGQDDN